MSGETSEILRLSRCPQCDYDLSGLPAQHACPECGSAYESEMFDLHGWHWEQRPSSSVLMWEVLLLLVLSVFPVLLAVRIGSAALPFLAWFALIGASWAWRWHRRRKGHFQVHLLISRAGVQFTTSSGARKLRDWHQFSKAAVRRIDDRHCRLTLFSRRRLGLAVRIVDLYCESNPEQDAALRHELRRRITAAQRD